MPHITWKEIEEALYPVHETPTWFEASHPCLVLKSDIRRVIEEELRDHTFERLNMSHNQQEAWIQITAGHHPGMVWDVSREEGRTLYEACEEVLRLYTTYIKPDIPYYWRALSEGQKNRARLKAEIHPRTLSDLQSFYKGRMEDLVKSWAKKYLRDRNVVLEGQILKAFNELVDRVKGPWRRGVEVDIVKYVNEEKERFTKKVFSKKPNKGFGDLREFTESQKPSPANFQRLRLFLESLDSETYQRHQEYIESKTERRWKKSDCHLKTILPFTSPIWNLVRVWEVDSVGALREFGKAARADITHPSVEVVVFRGWEFKKVGPLRKVFPNLKAIIYCGMELPLSDEDLEAIKPLKVYVYRPEEEIYRPEVEEIITLTEGIRNLVDL